MSILGRITSGWQRENTPTIHQEMRPEEVVWNTANAQCQLMLNGARGSVYNIPTERGTLGSVDLPNLLGYTDDTRAHFRALRGILALFLRSRSRPTLGVDGAFWVRQDTMRPFENGFSAGGDNVSLSAGIRVIGDVHSACVVTYDANYGSTDDKRQIGYSAAPCYPERVALNNFAYIPESLIGDGSWLERWRVIKKTLFPIAEWPYIVGCCEERINKFQFRVTHALYRAGERAQSMELCEFRQFVDKTVVDTLTKRGNVPFSVIHLGRQKIGEVMYHVFTGMENPRHLPHSVAL